MVIKNRSYSIMYNITQSNDKSMEYSLFWTPFRQKGSYFSIYGLKDGIWGIKRCPVY